MRVEVRNNDINKALRVLKRKMQNEGIMRDMKLKEHYEKPSEKKRREHAEAIKRARKTERRRLERDGY